MEKKTLKDIISQKRLVTVKEIDGNLASKVSLSIGKKKEAKDYYAKAEDLQKIKSLVELSESQVFVFELEAADMKVDRSDERFSRSAHEKMLTLAIKNRIPVLLGQEYDHEWKAVNTKGIVFDGYISDEGVLTYKAYFPAIESNKDVIAGLMTGLYNKLSVGFSMNPTDYICDSCGRPIVSESCPHHPGMEDEKGNRVTVTIKDVLDNFEVSIVAVPCQPDTNVKTTNHQLSSITKSLDFINWIKPEPAPQAINLEELKLSVQEAIKQALQETPENSPVDKIINDSIGTIEDSVMSEETKTPEMQDAPAVDSAVLEAKLSEIAESIKEIQSNVAEIKAKEIDLSEVKTALAELKALIEKPVVEKTDEQPAPELEAVPQENSPSESEVVLASLKEVTEALKAAQEALREASTVPTKTVQEKTVIESASDSTAKLLDELFGQ